MGLFFLLSLQHRPLAQTPDTVSVISENQPVQNELISVETDKEHEEASETDKPNHKLIAAVCLFIITTTLLLYHVRSK